MGVAPGSVATGSGRDGSASVRSDGTRPLTTGQRAQLQSMLKADREAVARVARLQTALEQTRANIRAMEVKMRMASEQEAEMREQGDSAISEAMTAVLSATTFLKDGTPAAPVGDAPRSAAALGLDVGTADKVRGWYQAEIDRLTHQVARLESELQTKDADLSKLRLEMHQLKMSFDTERSELQMQISRSRLALDEKVEGLESQHRRKLAAAADEAQRSIEDLRTEAQREAQLATRRTRATVVCESVVRRLYQRKMWQAWSTWVRSTYTARAQDSKMRSLLLRMMNRRKDEAWRKWREHVHNAHTQMHRHTLGLARKETADFRKIRALERLNSAYKQHRRALMVTSWLRWKDHITESVRHDDAVRAHGALMRRCIRRLTNTRLVAGMNRWKLFVFYCKQAEMGVQITHMEARVDEAKAQADAILRDAEAKRLEEEKRRDAAIEEERKLQERLQNMVEAKEKEIKRIHDEKSQMTIRVFARRWLMHGVHKTFAAWKNYAATAKVKRKEKKVSGKKKELAMLRKQLAKAQGIVGNPASSPGEKAVAKAEIAALTNMVAESEAELQAVLMESKHMHEVVEQKAVEEQSRSMFERLASAKEQEFAKQSAAKEEELARIAKEQRVALQKVVDDRERLISEKEAELKLREAEHKAAMRRMTIEAQEMKTRLSTAAAVKQVQRAIQRYQQRGLLRGWNTWTAFVRRARYEESIGADRTASLRRIVRMWRRRALAWAWTKWHKTMMLVALETSVQFADDANHRRLAALQAAQQARAQAEWLISAAHVAKGEAEASQAQSRSQKQLIEALVAEVKNQQAKIASMTGELLGARAEVEELKARLVGEAKGKEDDASDSKKKHKKHKKDKKSKKDKKDKKRSRSRGKSKSKSKSSRSKSRGKSKSAKKSREGRSKSRDKKKGSSSRGKSKKHKSRH